MQLLHRRGPRTASQLAAALGVTAVAVRRHVAALERDRLVEAAPSDRGTGGRPAVTYRLTDAGQETFPRHYDRIAHEALSFLGDGQALQRFLAWRNEHLTRRYADRVHGESPEERVHALAEALDDDGFMAEVETAEDGLRLCQHNCTVEHVATAHPDVCASETELFSRLLGAPVVRKQTIADGAVRCETHLPTTPASTASSSNPTTSNPTTSNPTTSNGVSPVPSVSPVPEASELEAPELEVSEPGASEASEPEASELAASEPAAWPQHIRASSARTTNPTRRSTA